MMNVLGIRFQFNKKNVKATMLMLTRSFTMGADMMKKAASANPTATELMPSEAR